MEAGLVERWRQRFPHPGRRDLALRRLLDPDERRPAGDRVILTIGGGAGLIASIVLMVMRNRNKRSAEVFEQRRYIEPPV
jgi:hypothetical protein